MARFYPRLDGLRAFAVFAVMVFHWSGPELLGRTLPLGIIGVQLFFVLSGFLIGGILLRAHDRNALERTSQAFTLRQFVIRRALRIFPAYFAFLLITAVALGVPDPEWWWYPLYLSNFSMATTVEWPSYWSHTWTLAVEEQFYLFAPLMALFLQRKTFAVALPSFVVASGAFVLLAPVSTGMQLVPPKAFYGLLLGVALALVAERHAVPPKGVAVFGLIAGVVSTAAFVFDLHDGRLFFLVLPISCTALVWWATGTGPAGRFLEWRPLLHLGALAYGLYLWHMPASEFWRLVGLPELQNDWAIMVCYSVMTYVLARLSWTLIERPLNSRKSRFPYHRSIVVVDQVPEAQPATR